MPIDLINQNWEAVVKVIILKFENSDGRTTGKYQVIKIYSDKEKEILTKYWRENIQIIKGKRYLIFLMQKYHKHVFIDI